MTVVAVKNVVAVDTGLKLMPKSHIHVEHDTAH